MKKSLFPKKPSLLVCLSLVFLLLLTAVVYACSGLDAVQMDLTSLSTSHETMEGGPCTTHNEDICKSVHYRMLSLQTSSALTKVALQVSNTLLEFPRFEVPRLMNLLPVTGPPGIVFRPIFKLSFLSSDQVLRL